jgi:hypothetical protein
MLQYAAGQEQEEMIDAEIAKVRVGKIRTMISTEGHRGKAKRVIHEGHQGHE